MSFMKRSYFLLLFFMLIFTAISGQNNVTGVITSSDDQLPVIGVSVSVKGTTRGVVTNYDGLYSISASKNETLVFSYVGMETQEQKVGNQSVINVILKPDTKMLEEVVVTAMGVKAEKKKLNFAVQTLNSDELTAGQSQNFVNTLQGKVSGINVTNTGGSPNSGSLITIRGISSINPSQNNQPLFIVDGMAIRGSGTNIIDINPNDIEDVTVLKGAAAAALYGQEAANGVIMITTKNGKSGKMVTSASASLEVANAVRTPGIQGLYGPGTMGVNKLYSGGGWGPLIQPNETVYDNINNFLKTGFLQRYNVSASGGSDKFAGYASLAYSKNQGIVPNDYLDKYNLLLKADIKVSNSVKANFQSNTIYSQSRGFGNAMSSVYNWPINDDITNYMNPDGSIRWRNNPEGMNNDEKLSNSLSPLWSRYMDNGVNKSTRNILIGSLTWTPIKKLDLTGKLSYDATSSSSESYSVPRFLRSDFDYTDPANDPLANSLSVLGSYYLSQSNNSQLTGQFLSTYEYGLTRDLNLNLLLGAEMKTYNSLGSVLSGDEFRIPGDFYSYMNIVSSELRTDRSVSHSEKNTAGLFSELRLDYKSLVQLSGTYRKDYSSTLSVRDYDYYSFTGGVIFSELLNLKNDYFTYGKIRGNWARVGKDTNPYKLSPSFTIKSTLPDPGYAIDPTLAYGINVLPEMTDSWEIGTDLRFFKNRTVLDVAYYSTVVDNQIVTVRVSPAAGSILQVRNEGTIKNHGLELGLSQDIIKKKDIGWNAKVNFSFNRGKVIKLPDQLTELQGTQYGDIFPTAYLNGSTTSISGLDYLRDSLGRVIINESGYPKINPAKGNLIGNREPDFLVGLLNTFNYKQFTLSFMFDTRKGGDVANITGRSLLGNGMSKFHEIYRNREFIFDGVVQGADGSLVPNSTPVILNQQTINTYINNVSSNFIEDGSYIRLSYVTLAYDLSKLIRGSLIKGLNASFTGRNLLLLTKYTGSDPQINADVSSGGSGAMGIDNFGVPTTRNFNFTLTATF